MTRVPAALPLLAAALLLEVGAAAPLPAQAGRGIDSGRFRIRGSGGAVATEVFAVRRDASSVKSVARLTAGSDTAVLSDRITEARLQTNAEFEPVLFELQVQRGERLNLVGVRSGSRFRLRTRNPAGERWKEFLIPSGLVLLPDGFAHFHHFLFRQRENEGEQLTALLPTRGIRRPVRFRDSRADTIRVSGRPRAATRWEVTVGDQRRLIWRSTDGLILRVEIPDRGWVARRVPGSGPSRSPSPDIPPPAERIPSDDRVERPPPRHRPPEEPR